MNPDQVLAKDALADCATTIKNGEEYQLIVLRNRLRKLIRKEASV
jgi:hypothetical protein